MNNTLEILQKARREKGITLKELSKISGVSLGTVNKLFSGAIQSVKVETATKLANALNIDLNGKDNVNCDGKVIKSYGFVRCAAVTNEVRVGDVDYNVETTCQLIRKLFKKNVNIAVFQELSLTSYSAGDLFYQDTLLKNAKEGLIKVAKETKGMEMIVVLGFPFSYNGKIYNCAGVVYNGEVLAVIPKKNLPNYNEFNEKRWFAEGDDEIKYVDFNGKKVPFGCNIILRNRCIPEVKLSCEVCEDIWVPDSPSIAHCLNGATIIANLSASNEVAGKMEYRRHLCAMQSSKCICGYIYSSAGKGESTSDVVFGGHNIICETGRILEESKPFENGIAISDIDVKFIESERYRKFNKTKNNENYLYVDFDGKWQHDDLMREFSKTPFVPVEKSRLAEKCEEVLNIQAYSLASRIKHINCKKLVLGVSGGLDSTLAMLVCEKALKIAEKSLEDLVAVIMPCFGTSSRTFNNANIIAEQLKCTKVVIDIKESVLKHFKDIGHDGKTLDVTYENSQARERTQVLMDYANKVGGIVVGTGDLSEIALGWSTYNGDHMSMYNVNCGVPKTLIKEMVMYFASIRGGKLGNALKDIADTPVSPELKPPENGVISQSTENFVGPYILNDFFMYYLLKHCFSPSKVYYIAVKTFADMYQEDIIYKWLHMFIKRFFNSQFKRSCSPDGVKTGALCLSSRGGFNMPSDACGNLWIKDLESVKNNK